MHLLLLLRMAWILQMKGEVRGNVQSTHGGNMKFRILMTFLLLLVPLGCERQAEQPGENPQLAEARKENADLQRQIEGYKQELAAKQEQLDNALQELEAMKQSRPQNQQPMETKPPPSGSPDTGQPRQQMETPQTPSGAGQQSDRDLQFSV